MDDKLTKLAQFLKRYEQKPFVWGKHDCVIFAADAVKAMTGHDLAKSYRGLYTNQFEAYEIIVRADGLEKITDKECKTYGFSKRDHPMKAQRGDLVMLFTKLGDTMGIVSENGKDIYVADQIGYRKLPFKDIKAAWQI